MSAPLRVFVGFDHRQIVSYTVLHTSITLNAQRPVTILPLVLPTLPITRTGLTPFTYSRFLVPWLCGYEGRAVFMDSDTAMAPGADLSDIMEHATGDHDVWCVKHLAHPYEWSSVMVFDNARCRDLTPEYIDDPDSRPLSLDWAASVGDLPGEWNHLVGYDELRTDAKVVHFTQGVPAFSETRDCEYAGVWHHYLKAALSTKPWAELMGNSRHAKPVRDRLRKQAYAEAAHAG